MKITASFSFFRSSFSRVSFLRASFAFVAALLLASLPANAGSKKSAQNIPAFPGSLSLSHYVYVTSYDGDLFDPNLFPEDRRAITAVQDAIEKSGKFTLVYKSEQADMVLAVTGRPTEDVLAAYDAAGWRRGGQYLWRMTGRNGLQPSETPLVTDLLTAFDQAAKH
jgi:hypothetical protein